jgi:hypothetical protein
MPVIINVTVDSAGFAGSVDARCGDADAQAATATAKTTRRTRLNAMSVVLSRIVGFYTVKIVPLL